MMIRVVWCHFAALALCALLFGIVSDDWPRSSSDWPMRGNSSGAADVSRFKDKRNYVLRCTHGIANINGYVALLYAAAALLYCL
jgi:hypothetical protein